MTSGQIVGKMETKKLLSVPLYAGSDTLSTNQEGCEYGGATHCFTSDGKTILAGDQAASAHAHDEHDHGSTPQGVENFLFSYRRLKASFESVSTEKCHTPSHEKFHTFV